MQRRFEVDIRKNSFKMKYMKQLKWDFPRKTRSQVE